MLSHLFPKHTFPALPMHPAIPQAFLLLLPRTGIPGVRRQAGRTGVPERVMGTEEWGAGDLWEVRSSHMMFAFSEMSALRSADPYLSPLTDGCCGRGPCRETGGKAEAPFEDFKGCFFSFHSTSPEPYSYSRSLSCLSWPSWSN